MEGIRSKLEAAQMIECDFDAPLFLYPVRHHSPVCSYHLKSVIARYRPDMILIEGPENANDLIDVLADEHTRLPAAIYYFYKDKKKLISDEGEDHKCYYPFLYSSPEYNAMRAARERGIPARFIDLPFAEILINTKVNKGLRQSGGQSYADDSKLTRSDYYKKLCEKTGERCFDEFWEKRFEISGLYMSDEEFLKAMHTYCHISREQTDISELENDATLARERYMAANIAQAMKEYKRVLVVTGGFHSEGLQRLLCEGKDIKKPKLHSLPKESTGSFPAAYSYESADALRGYASGMRGPYFYDRIFKALEENESPEGIYSDIALSFLVDTAKEASKKDIAVSIADITAAQTMLSGLAALRGVRECGLFELFDGVTSAFVKGEKNISSSQPLDILERLTRGDAVGHIGDSTHTPPLIKDMEEQCEKLSLRANTAVPQEVDAALFTTKKGLPLSRFLHRMKFLGTGFASRIKGPDLRIAKDRSRVRELWKYRRSPAVDAALIDHTADGFTIEEACRNLALKRLADERRAEVCAGIYVDLFLCGIGIDESLPIINDVLANDGDMISVGKALAALHMLDDLHELYGSEDSGTKQMIELCFSKLLTALPTSADVPDEQAEDIVKILRQMYLLTDSTLAHRRDEFEGMLKTIAESDKKHPAIYGCAYGLLYAFDEKFEKPAELAMQGFLNGSAEVRKKGAQYISGLFTAARDIVFSGTDFLRLTDRLITSFDSEDFLEILPSLRLAFSTFTPREIQDTAKAAAALYDMGEDDILYKKATDEGLYRYGLRLDEIIANALEGEGF